MFEPDKEVYLSYRPAPTPEFIEALGDLGALKRWQQHVWLARALYGPFARRMVVTAEWRDVVPVEGHEMDEPCVAAHITDVAISDDRGKLLSPDLRLPHWQERIAQLDLAQLTGAGREAAIVQVVFAACAQLGVVLAGSMTYRVHTPPAPR
jgi:hypothetical protein